MVDILAFGAHPDDIEFACGGILAKMAAQGKSIVMIDLTIGEKATNGTPEQRRLESMKAAAVIGAQREILDFQDCEMMDTYEGRLKFVRVIRKYKPRLIIAPLWEGTQNHPDHLASGQMARHACRYARFAKILPDMPTQTPEGILHYPPNGYSDRVDFVIDITEHVETWKQMILYHQSQLKTRDYLEWQMRAAAKYGLFIGKPYAQGLLKGNPIKVDDLMHIAQGSIEL